MKKVSLIVLALAVLAFVAVSASAGAKATTVTGWVGDSKCGAHGAQKADCVAKCVQAGAAPVLVSDKDQSVLKIDNPDAVKDHLGHHVTVTGHVDNGSIHVDSVAMVPGN
ncbi:MAG TPA: hypothetical protein VLT85_11490 [Terriglobales bacterium]|nr:hypothetical protein [Terriglobales bacterium]HXZ27955.1 hypothetical protein [Terriglobales bacterium]